jgi:hypothetical protein
VHTRSFDLPLDCFEEGEKRPERTKSKKSKTKKANGVASTSTNPVEAKKRPGDGHLQPQASKKQHLDGTSDVSGVTKRALDQEVR